MARAASKNSRQKTSASGRRKKKNRRSLTALLSALLLLLFLIFSVGVLTYVVFFRMVVAAELQPSGNDVMFEEPHRPIGNMISSGEATQTDQPEFAIVIDDMGYHLEAGRDLINLDLNLSFSFLPHAPFTPELEKLAYQKGKTILLHLPLQPKDANWDPGPGALYLDESEEQHDLFLGNLERVPYATGVNNHMGSLYTERSEVMRPLLQLISEKGLFFIDSFTTSGSVGFALARDLGVKTAQRDIFLDNVVEINAVCGQIEELVRIAQGRGRAIGIAHPHRQTYEALRSCLEGVDYPARLVSVDRLLP